MDFPVYEKSFPFGPRLFLTARKRGGGGCQEKAVEEEEEEEFASDGFSFNGGCV